MTRLPKIGDPVSYEGKRGVVTALVDEDGEVDDPEDAVALTVEWEDGMFSALLLSDLEFTRFQ